MKRITSLLGAITLTCGLAVTGYSQSFLTNGLVAYYPFNGNANDASGNGYNGTVNGATLATDRFGYANASYSFNGTDNYIRLPLNTGNLNGSTQVTISAWINPTTTNYACIFSHWVDSYVTPPTPVGIMFDIFNRNHLLGSLASDSDSVRSSDSATINQWTFVTMVFDGTQPSTNRVRLFMNGIPLGATFQNASAIPAQVASLATDTLIGARASQLGLVEFFSGALDDVRIYDRALSTSEVQQLYAYESQPIVALKKAVKPSFSNLFLGTNYQLQLSGDMKTWTNQGSPFTPTNTVMDYPQYWDVDNWNSLFFRLQTAP